MKKLSNSVIEKLKYYVYILIDPRDDKVFYIWKWKWNRIYSHLNWAIKWDKPSDKINQILEILHLGHQIKHYIVRHWLSEKEALEVEGALIDYHWKNNLTNQMLWHNSNERWIMDMTEVNINYDAKEVNIKDNVILININNLYYFWIWEKDLYEATRKSWVLNPDRANKADFAFTHYHWIIREVYNINYWYKSEEFKNVNETEWKVTNRRYEFKGKIASENIREKYLHKSIKKYFKQGSQNPIKYVNI